MEKTAQKIQELQDRCALLEQQNGELMAKLKWFEEQFFLNQKRRFGRSSEQSDSKQLQIFNEAEKEADPSKPEPTMEEYFTCVIAETVIGTFDQGELFRFSS